MLSLLTKEFDKTLYQQWQANAMTGTIKCVCKNEACLDSSHWVRTSTWRRIQEWTWQLHYCKDEYESIARHIPVLSPCAIGMYRCHRQHTGRCMCWKMPHSLPILSNDRYLFETQCYWHYGLLYTRHLNEAGVCSGEVSICRNAVTSSHMYVHVVIFSGW